MVIRINGFATRLVILRLADVALAQHTGQHNITTSRCAVKRIERVKGGWRFGQPGNDRHLTQGELVDGFAKVDLCRRTHTISTITEVNLIEVKLEDLVFIQ